MKLISIGILVFLSALSNALDHPVSHAQLMPDESDLDRLHDAYNGFLELQKEFSQSTPNEHDDRDLGLGDALLCRVQLASCQSLTASANVEMWAGALQPMQSSILKPLYDILSLATSVAKSVASLATLGTLKLILGTAESILTILSELFGSFRNARQSTFDTLSAMESIDTIVHETGLAFSPLGPVWFDFWSSINAAWSNARLIVSDTYAISETLFVSMYQDVIKASAGFMLAFWTTVIEYVSSASTQRKLACATDRIECSYEMWVYEMFPSLATLSMINGTQSGE